MTVQVANRLDPDLPGVRTAARRLAASIDDDSDVGSVVRSMLRDVAGGERIVVLRARDELSPAGAAELLGVSRQYVDRLCEDGVLPFRRLPGSRHRRIQVADVLAVAEERGRRRSGRIALRSALAASGLLDDE